MRCADLAQLAHGIFPRVLATEGLRAALEDLPLAGRPDARSPLDGDVDDDVPCAIVAMAAHATVAAALDAAEASHGDAGRRSSSTATRAARSIVRIDADAAARSRARPW